MRDAHFDVSSSPMNYAYIAYFIVLIMHYAHIAWHVKHRHQFSGQPGFGPFGCNAINQRRRARAGGENPPGTPPPHGAGAD
jgi:hypothetical protein